MVDPHQDQITVLPYQRVPRRSRLRIAFIWLSFLAAVVVAIGLFMQGDSLLYSLRRYNNPSQPNTRIVTTSLVEQVQLRIEEYHRTTGAYPIGDNAAIAQALSQLGSARGESGLEAPVTLGGYRLRNDRGEIVDAWGRALLVHFEEDGRTVLYSCGANGLDERGGGDDIYPAPAEDSAK